MFGGKPQQKCCKYLPVTHPVDSILQYNFSGFSCGGWGRPSPNTKLLEVSRHKKGMNQRWKNNSWNNRHLSEMAVDTFCLGWLFTNEQQFYCFANLQNITQNATLCVSPGFNSCYQTLKIEFPSTNDNANSICINFKINDFKLIFLFSFASLSVWAIIIYHWSINLHKVLWRPTYHLVCSSITGIATKLCLKQKQVKCNSSNVACKAILYINRFFSNFCCHSSKKKISQISLQNNSRQQSVSSPVSLSCLTSVISTSKKTLCLPCLPGIQDSLLTILIPTNYPTFSSSKHCKNWSNLLQHFLGSC